MAEKIGLKETKEIIVAVKALAIDVIEGVKDGISMDDLTILFKNMDKMKVAMEGVGEVGAEMKDLDMLEIKELVAEGMDLVFAIIEALKKEKV